MNKKNELILGCLLIIFAAVGYHIQHKEKVVPVTYGNICPPGDCNLDPPLKHKKMVHKYNSAGNQDLSHYSEW